MAKVLLIVIGTLVVAVATAAMIRMGPENLIGMMRYDRRREGDLKVGDRAPDVALYRLDGSSRARLLEFTGGKPLVLVFGSFT